MNTKHFYWPGQIFPDSVPLQYIPEKWPHYSFIDVSLSLSLSDPSLLSHLSVFVCHSVDLDKLSCWTSIGLMVVERGDTSCPSQLSAFPLVPKSRAAPQGQRYDGLSLLKQQDYFLSQSQTRLIAQTSELSSSLNQKILFGLHNVRLPHWSRISFPKPNEFPTYRDIIGASLVWSLFQNLCCLQIPSVRQHHIYISLRMQLHYEFLVDYIWN